MKFIYQDSVEPKPSETLLTNKELQQFLKISQCTTILWRKKGLLKTYKAGRIIYFKKDEVLQVLKLQKIKKSQEKQPFTIYVFNSNGKLINKGKIHDLAKKYNLSPRKIYYLIVSCSFLELNYFSRNKEFKIPPKRTKHIITGGTTLEHRKSLVNSTKRILRCAKLKKLREKHGLSTKRLSIALGISFTGAWNLENIPFHNPRISLMIKLAKYYNVKIEELIYIN